MTHGKCEALTAIIERLDRLKREAEAVGLDMLALSLEQAKDEAERRLAERRKRSPPSTEN